jgi:hypothetical protein
MKTAIELEETNYRKSEAQKERWEKYKDVKLCMVCGQKFTRRDDETRLAFKNRKKCHARCTSDTYAAIDVLSYGDLKNIEGFGDDDLENTFLSLTWLSQSRHWLRFY